MKVYLYDEKTKVYEGVGKADPCQLVKGDFIHPANSTTIEPINVSEGKVAKFIGGEWVESEPVKMTTEEIERLRAIEYANPIRGSDRYFLEAARKRAALDETGAIAAESAGLARVTEIKNQYK